VTLSGREADTYFSEEHTGSTFIPDIPSVDFLFNLRLFNDIASSSHWS
jgi:hypothetical protein